MNIGYRVDLSDAERSELQTLLRGGRHAARKLKRAQILLAADAGVPDDTIAQSLGVGGSTVYRTKRRRAAAAARSEPGRRRHGRMRRGPYLGPPFRCYPEATVGTREFRKELTLSFAVNSLLVDHAPFDPANFSEAPSGALLFWQERDGQESARLLALILA